MKKHFVINFHSKNVKKIFQTSLKKNHEKKVKRSLNDKIKDKKKLKRFFVTKNQKKI